MVPHVLIVDDEAEVLDSLVPSLVVDFARALAADPRARAASQAAGGVFPVSGRINIGVSAVGYASAKTPAFSTPSPVHLRLHLCRDQGGAFPNTQRLLKDHFVAVVVSDLRFSNDAAGSRAGRYLIEDMARRNPQARGVLYSAYQRPDGFPPERFVRKGASEGLGSAELVAKMVDGVADYLASPAISRLGRELTRRGLAYQSDEFGSVLRRLADYAELHFGPDPPNPEGRRRPRPTLLIDGETGTGKTELAGLLHALSERRDAPFVAATCNQLTDITFLRSALFGHVKGSFSGAAADRAGLVESAGAGFLLLDDLHKLTDAGSVILHSFLDDGEYSRLGQDEVRRRSAAALVATVETPRWEEIKSQRLLAESFLHRVEQLVLRVPPLRARAVDIALQAENYCRAQAERLGVEMELGAQAVAWLIEHGFPGGNSRKLRDFLFSAVSANAKVTDYLGATELEEHARDHGLDIGRSGPMARVPASLAPTVLVSDPPPAIRPDTDAEAGRWRARVARLAAIALVADLGQAPQAAASAAQTLFEQTFPDLWQALQAVARSVDPSRPMEIRLFDELLRYYAVHRAGSPTAAAKLLGMKDNALREFIYSREQKRGVDKEA